MRRGTWLLILMVSLASACSSDLTPPEVRVAALQGDASDPFTLAVGTNTTKTLTVTTQTSHFYRLTVPANQTGLRVAVKSTGSPVDLQLHQDTATGGVVASTSPDVVGTLFRTTEETAGQTWYVEVHADQNATYTIAFEAQYSRALSWDPGTSLTGTQAQATPANGFGDYLYTITSKASIWGAWRTVLRVTTGEADLVLQQGSFPYDYAQWSSSATGSDATLLGPYEFDDNQTWYVRVKARTAATTWSLVSGDVYVQDLGAVATSSSNLSVTPDVFGHAYFKTQVAGDILAWRLAAPQSHLYLAQTTVPIPRRSDTVLLDALNETLVVPPILTSGQFLVAVEASGARTIDSRRQAISDAPGDKFEFTVNGNDSSGYGYVTYKLEVPVDQIAWRVAVTPGAIGNDVDMYVKRNAVPAEYDNGGFSEVYGATDTITQVPPSLSNGTWYVTVRGQAPFTFTLVSGNPVVTDMPFVTDRVSPPCTVNCTVANGPDFVNQVGWRYFRVGDIQSQVGTLGWILDLAQHVPGTEIAIRRNALPGRWSQRARSGTTSYESVTEHVDAASTTGFLERPNHEADVWYVGIYLADQALGDFTLRTRTFMPTTLTFNGGSLNVTNQVSGRWRYYKVTVPPDALGWDLRLDSVTSGRPRLVLRSELLPPDFTTNPGYPYPVFLYDAWGSGQQWAVGNDLTSRPQQNVAGDYVDESGRFVLAGMGAPLREGVVYVGVNDDPGTSSGQPMSYTITSRGIGSGATWSLPVQTLAFTNGSATVSGLAARDLRVYRVDVPTNSESFALELHPTAGDALMAVARGNVPNSEAGYYYNDSEQPNGTRRQKTGDDFFYRYPSYSDAGVVPAGAYYAVVASEGVVSESGVIGTGSASYTITSRGLTTVKGSATTSVSDGSPLAFANESLRYGEQRAYRFTVPPGVSSLEVRLQRLAGHPTFSIIDAQGPFPTPQQSYNAAEGGLGAIASDDDIVTLQAPSGVYTVLVSALTDDQGQEVGASYNLTVEARGESLLAFNGGEAAVTGHESQTWRYFKVTVPTGALGWDLRLENVTSGSPRMVIRRDSLPESHTTTSFGYYASIYDFDHWDTGWSWAPGADLSGRSYTPYNETGSAVDESGRRVSLGMGSPLEPGTYYVGVSDTYTQQSGEAMSYSLVSRGIGIGNDASAQPWVIQVRDLDFATGTHTATLQPRDIAYYRVNVPAGRTSWQLDLSTTTGEAMLALRQGRLPNAAAQAAYGYDYDYTFAGTRRQKDGTEYFYRYLDHDQAEVVPGYTYLAVAAEGASALYGSYIGSGPTTYTLRAKGLVPVTNAAQPLGATPIRFANQALPYGAQKTYRVQVPSGTVSMEARLENKSGGPYLSIGPADGTFPSPYTYGYTAHQGGESGSGQGNNIVTVAQPDGTYLITVTANLRPDGQVADATYDLVVQAVDDAGLAFNGGSVSVSAQESQTWRYFRVHVPTGALGWDLRLEDVTSGHPRMVIRRDELPADFGTTSFGYYASIFDLDRWDTGWQWSPSADLSGRPYGVYDPDSGQASEEYGRRVSMGLGAPLEAGDYVIGVSDTYDYNATEPMSYRLVSRGIGQGNDASGTAWSIQVRDVTFGQTATATNIQPRDNVYYRVVVPDGLESFGARLTVTAGEAAMAVRRGTLPSAAAPSYNYFPIDRGAGQRRQKSGDEYFYKLPSDGESKVAGGVHYFAVAAEGADPYSTSYLGTGPSSWTLTTFGPVPITGGIDRVIAPGSPEIVFAGQTQAYGALKVFRVRVTRTVKAVEIRLRNKVGGPHFAAAVHEFFAAHPVAPYQPYYQSVDGGSATQWQGDVADQIVGVTGDLTIAVSSTDLQNAVDASYDLVIKPLGVAELGWDGGHANVSLEDQGAALYHVVVPQDCDGVAQAGWIVTQATEAGSVGVQVRKDVLPEAPGSTQTLATQSKQTIIVPPYLEPGDWYVMVTATGTALATLDTQEVKDARHWTMPKRGEIANVPGLSHPAFGDSGVLDNGQPVVNAGSTDQGVDLAEGTFRFYRVTVPKLNAGLMRTRIEAISGNPDLYIRRGAAPTSSQIPGYPYGYNWDYSDTLTGSSYGHWVAPDTRYGVELAPGEYWLGVYAQGSNVRYRLKLDLGRVDDLALTAGSAHDALAAGDMRYYRVQVPQTNVTQSASTPIDWKLTFTQQDGDAAVFVREGVPPGLYSTVPVPLPNQSYDYLLRDWNGDRNAYAYGSGPLPYVENTGLTTLSLPLVRPNTTYYLGVYARTDTTFDIASAVGATRQKIDGVLAFDSGVVDATLAAGAKRLYRIDVPADGARWLHDAEVPDGVNLYLSQGLIPPESTSADWTNNGQSYQSDLDRPLLAPDGYVGNFPFVPGESYYLLIANDSGAPAHVVYTLDGRSQIDDDDADGLPDGWEYDNFGSLYYDAAVDVDGDGLSNGEEYALGTSPRDVDSDHDGLGDSAELFAGGDPLVSDTDHDLVCDGSDSAPDDPTESGPVIRLTMHAYEGGQYGNGYGTNVHRTRLAAIFDRASVKQHWLHITGWDIEGATEVQVFVNGHSLGYLPVGGNNQESIPVLWFLDDALLVSAPQVNRVELRAAGGDTTWGVKDMGLFSYGDTFGRDDTQAYDSHHAAGFDIRWPAPLPDALIELRAFDLEQAGDITITMDGQPLFSPFPASADLQWGRYWQVPILSSDYPQSGERVIRVRPRAGSDGQYQLRLVDTRPITTTFGTYGDRGEDSYATEQVSFLVPKKSELRELILSFAATEGGGITSSGTLALPAVWPALEGGQESKPQFFFSQPAASDTLGLDQVAVADAESPLFTVRVQYYGPCRDTDYDSVLDCDDAFPNDDDEWDDLDHDGLGDNWETRYFNGLGVASATSDIDGDGKRDDAEFADRDDPACADLDDDSYLGATQYCTTGSDCDDHNPAIGPSVGDNDCDGVPSAADCDDNNSAIGASAGDQDCDGVATALDCNDHDAQIGARALDLDCDGVPNASDCDPSNASIGSNVDDLDCDGVANAIDCAPTNPAVTSSNVGDMDCDGVPDGLDCAPNNPFVTTTNVGDLDCDGVGDAVDCAPADPAITRSLVGDRDCDGVPDGLDCAPDDPTITTGAAGDRDCDGIPDAVDCAPDDASERHTKVNDGDCDGVPDPLDCAPSDATDSRSNVGDSDCDGVPNALDCAPEDAQVTTSRAGDDDCDGRPDAEDCSAHDATDQRRCDCVDADHDEHFAITEGCPIGDDCDDDDKDGTLVTEDADCDGSLTIDDCDDADPTVVGACPIDCEDLDGDGADGQTASCSTGTDCDDADPDSTTLDVDGDCDGAPDARDVCPGVADDQSDSDGDGVGDACDNCAAIANAGQEDVNDNELGDACEDFDGDGVIDERDNCPGLANPDQADVDGDGLGDRCDPSDDGEQLTHQSADGGCGAGGAGELVGLVVIGWALRRRSRRP